jgi:ceramide glucosyltransferase
MLPAAKHETLVLSDSDIRVPADYLRKVVGTLEQPNTGAVSCLYRGTASDNFWSKMAAMGIDYQFLPSVVCGVSAGLTNPFFGSTVALRKHVLAEIGGFEPFGDRLQDDYEIGRAVRARQYGVSLAPLIVSHSCAERSAADMLRHELRWARTIRTIDPAGYAGSIITHMVPLGLLGAFFLDFSYPSLLALSVALAARQLIKRAIDRSIGASGLSGWLLLPRDVLSFAVFVGSFFSKRVDWQGHPYRVNAAGALVRE